MLIIDIVKMMWGLKQIEKFEKARPARPEKEEKEREQLLKDTNGILATMLLCECIGDEDKTNEACDLIKKFGLVEGYE